MLENVKYFKNFTIFKLVFFLFAFSIFDESNASQKEDIIEKLKKTDSLEFNFIQQTNELSEEGQCILLFPSKLRCVYKDESKKILIINKTSLLIDQKRYRKKYIYNISNSPFIDILDKYKLITLIEEGRVINKKKKLEILSYNKSGRPITIMYDLNNFYLMGWKIKDNVGNDIIFSIKILAENKNYSMSLFKIAK